MKQSTDKKKLHWLSRCRIEDCNEDSYRCPECKHKAHISVHSIHNERGLGKASFQHSHFVEEQDGGRNIYCQTKFTEFTDGFNMMPQLTAEGKNELKEKFKQRFKRFKL